MNLMYKGAVMEIATNQNIVSMAIAYKKKHAVYVASHIEDFEGAVWTTFTKLIREKYPVRCEDMIFNTMMSSIFFFDTEEKALDFYKVFENNIIYASGLYAVLYDPFGNVLTENT